MTVQVRACSRRSDRRLVASTSMLRKASSAQVATCSVAQWIQSISAVLDRSHWLRHETVSGKGTLAGPGRAGTRCRAVIILALRGTVLAAAHRRRIHCDAEPACREEIRECRVVLR